jgi:hypothetical protein
MSRCLTELPELSSLPDASQHLFRCHLDEETRTREWSAKHAQLVAEDAIL